MADCRSCGAPIIWAITKNGRRLPLDPSPTPDGNIRLDLTNAHIIGNDDPYNGPKPRAPRGLERA